MLDILRKKASSIVVKILLGGIAIVFIFFFGSSTLRNPKFQGKDIVAKVNGNSITGGQLVGRLQMDKDSNPTYASLPENFQNQLRQAAIGELIQASLIETEAQKLGLSVSNEEVAEVIRQDPNLTKNGKFDMGFYQQQFRPGYENRYGMDYENAVRKSLLVQKLKNLFTGAVQVSDDDVKNHYALQNTRLSFKKVAVSQDQSVKLWPLFQQGKLTDAALKEAGLKEEEIPITPIAEIDSLFPGASGEALSGLIALTEQKPVAASPLSAEEKVFFVKLIKREEPDLAAFEKNKDKEKDDFREELAQNFFAKWYEEKARKAKIKIFE